VKKGKISDAEILRENAELILQRRLATSNQQLFDADIIKLIHELEVHQVELEMQNEELSQTKELLKVKSEKYLELYEYAPSGYFSLSKDGEILDLNYSGAKMLGKERSRLINSLFGFYVSEDSKPIFNHFLNKVFERKLNQTCDITIATKNNPQLEARLTGIVSTKGDKCYLIMVDITGEKNLAKLNSTLLESLPHPAMYIRSKDKVVLAVNKIALEMGVKPGGYCWREFMKSEFLSKSDEKIVAKYPDEVPSKYNIKCTFCLGDSCINGSPNQNEPKLEAFGIIWDTYWIKVSNEVYLHYAVNVTEKIRTKEALEKSQLLLRSSLESQNNTILLSIDKDFRYLYFNKAHSDAMKIIYNQDVEIGMNILECITSESDRIVARENYSRALNGESHSNIRQYGEKELVWYESFFNPIRTDNNEIIGATALARDITERLEKESMIRENELRLKSLVRIFQFNTGGINELLDFTLEEAILITNSKIGYIYRYDENTQQFTLHSWSKDVMKECAVIDQQQVYNLAETGIWGEAVRQRKPIVVNDFHAPNQFKKGYPEGHVEMHNFLTVPVFFEGKIVAVTGVANKEKDYKESDILHLTILMDNTFKSIHKINLTELIEKQNAELIKLNSDKDKFFSILAHDLKSPFNSILGFLEVLSSNIRNYTIHEIEENISIIDNSANRVYNLLNELLLWTRSQSGKIPFSPQIISFTKCCDEVVEGLILSANSKNIKIVCRSTDAVIYADIEMIKTVLRNLISNSIKYTNSGGFIRIKLKVSNTETIVSVKDNGIGMTPQIMKQLFDFSVIQSRKGTSDEVGTGMGLIICKEFVEKHGGSIWVKSEPGKGSNFKFSLPKS